MNNIKEDRRFKKKKLSVNSRNPKMTSLTEKEITSKLRRHLLEIYNERSNFMSRMCLYQRSELLFPSAKAI